MRDYENRAVQSGDAPAAREFGTVRWFDSNKGFGFISPDCADHDIFVHISAIVSGEPLFEGARVSYELAPARRGRLQATAVKLITE